LTAVQLQEPDTLPTQTSAPGFIRAWLPTFLWLVVIAIESSDLLSSHHTGRFLFPLFHWLFGLTPEQFEPVHAVIRKTGHVVGYGTLSVLAFRSFRASARQVHARWSLAWARNAILFTAAVASLDEWHQTFIPSRTGTIYDVMLDSCAAIAAQLLAYWFVRVRDRTARADHAVAGAMRRP
jgi:VanZ family protein